MALPLTSQDIETRNNIEGLLLSLVTVVVATRSKQFTNIDLISRCMKILKDEFMDELKAKYGAQQVDQVVSMD